MSTVEVAGRPIAVANLGAQAEAEEFFQSDWFKEEMMVVETEDGDDLWNGSDPFFIRTASPEEVARFKPAHARALQSGNALRSEAYIVFLTPVTDMIDKLD